VELTQHFFKRLYGEGYIYKEIVKQPYCERDEKFLPDRYIVGTCPHCGALRQYSDGCEACGKIFQTGEILDPSCALCGNKPIERESVHFFFKLSKFSDQLRKWLQGNSNLQPEVTNYVLNWITDGLRDWDVTRDIRWGVPVPLPEAEGKVLYGWFDNHICYISSTLKYLEEQNLDGKDYWNTSRIYHFIGKDIVYHHYLFLPAMRIGTGEEFKLPDFVPTRGHLLFQGQKFSKSRGHYVSLREFLKAFPADYLRYYLASITPYDQSDVNFSWKEFMSKINNELVANIGNFVYRVLSFLSSRFNLKVPEPKALDELDAELQNRIASISEKVGKKLESNRTLREIVDFSSYCNQYFQRKRPWIGGVESQTCLYMSTNAVRCLAILLAPFLVCSMEKLWKQLNLEGSIHEQSWSSASQVMIKSGHVINKPTILFRKIEPEEIAAQQIKPDQVAHG
jgi:methionyl-tRNA synthetase